MNVIFLFNESPTFARCRSATCIAHTTTMSDGNHTPIEKDETVINELLTKSLKSAAKIAEQKEREEL